MVDKKQKILITGASGYLGAHLSQALARSGYRITAFCRSMPNSEPWKNLMDNIVIGDIRDADLFSSSSMEKFDIILHLVSLDHHSSNAEPKLVMSVNLLPTWQLLERYKNKGLKKFINFSTIHVYGHLPFSIIKENFPVAPKTIYSMTHLISENICSYYNDNSDSDCLNVRLSNCYGTPVFQENKCWSLVINDLCKNVFNQNTIKLNSDGSPQRDFIHINDVISAIKILILEQKTDKLNTYNLATSKTKTIYEISNRIKLCYEKRYGRNINIVSSNGKKIDPPNVNQRHIISNEKLKKIGFQPKISFDHGINQLFDYLEGLIDV